MSTRINLLPWREAARKRRQQRFYAMLGAAAMIGALIWGGVHMYFAGRIDYQQERNDLLRTEISRLDQRIAKIRKLEETKQRLISRMEVIQKLQHGRPQIVHLFEQWSETLPDGLYLDKLVEKDDSITIDGLAESNARVSSYMENLNGSPWMTDPDLTVIEVEERNGRRVSDFTLKVRETAADNKADGEGDAG
ncbi:PilN domain-containing protein [Arhodomonas aquaeolei]|uniref:PilN domain-containing protein n=1 Tax=Arhodomonas aquaeolei TaxID=2369 RepID=UPI00036AF9D1|nr:PilN domain-containing protein [Arhodomonas aquaeolei]